MREMWRLCHTRSPAILGHTVVDVGGNRPSCLDPAGRTGGGVHSLTIAGPLSAPAIGGAAARRLPAEDIRMTEPGLIRSRWWKGAIGLCALWNLIYVAISAITSTPVFISRISSYFFLPIYAWLVWGLWKEKYSAWVIGLIACSPFALRGISKVIAVVLLDHRELILPMETHLQVIGVAAIVTNVLMGVLLLVYREEFSPGY
ncbi:MAG TPA: hypothetical protein VKW04_00805 [Planctomycetota bacterium]|nr:hypothetical protein [Planctomycetota bacterium]